MILLIDNYDSFTFNLVHLIGGLGETPVVKRNDAASAEAFLAMGPRAIVISPGPGRPAEAGVCVALVRAAAGRVPLLGVCLGHQAIAEAFGARIVPAKRIMHGKVDEIRHAGRGLFDGLPAPFAATRYHSLAVDRASLPRELEATAETEDGEIMGLAHKRHPLYGVQFHPESVATETGRALLENFLRSADEFLSVSS